MQLISCRPTSAGPQNGLPIERKIYGPATKSYTFQVFCSELLLKVDYFLGRLASYLDRRCVLPATPAVSNAPRTIWYRTPGKSFTLPPLTNTIECSWRLCPSPGM